MASLFLAVLTLLGAVIALGGLGWLVATVSPSRPLAVAAVFVFAFVAVSCTSTLLVWVVRRPRTEDGRLKSPAGYVPHAMLLAVIVLFGAWLQALRTLTPVVALMLIGLYALLELAVLFGTRGSVDLPIRR
jgi:hypothetical protein